ncbi:MAG TPA: hypothetical protein VEK57_11045 [Thermoanaerobaculia bacterium]|nr:hypothetical protein [Thermoanaerobaculia bacterium]
MTTVLWLVPLLALAIFVGYVWGRTGLSVMLGDYADFVVRGIVDLVRMEPWFQWRGLTGVLARGLTWVTWGAFLFVLGGIATVLFILFATLLTVGRFIREGFRGPTPLPPSPTEPSPHAALGSFFYRLLRPRTAETDAPAKPKIVRRASAATP